jgi:proteasome lid subunit RPN8/RPN11
MDRYKRAARKRAPLEYLEILLGKASEGTLEIVKSVKILHTASLDSSGEDPSCDYKDAALEVIKLKAEKEGLAFLGTIHSHPNGSGIPSESDNQSALDNQEQVFGIYSFQKNGKTGRITASKLCFYLPQTAVLIKTP